MVNGVFKNAGLYLVMVLFMRKISGSNVTEKSPSDSFVVSANYGVQSGSTKSTAENKENTNNYSQNAQPQYDGYSENSLLVNHNYEDYSKSYLPTTQGQDQGQSESNQTTYVRNTDVVPSFNEWHASVMTNPYINYDAHSHNVARPYYGEFSKSTTSVQPHQETPETYLKRTLSTKEIVKPSQTTVYNSYLPEYGFNVQNSNYQAQNTRQEDIVYGGNNSQNQKTLWSTLNSKMLNDRAYEIQNTWPTANEISNESHRPTVVQLQEMVNKIVKGTSKVHQVLKVPAVYEIHLQEEEEKPAGLDINNFQIPLSQGSTQKEQTIQPHISGHKWHSYGGSSKPIPPQRKKVFGPPQKWSKNRLPGKQKPWKEPQVAQESRHSIKTWNLPSKIKYFDQTNEASGPFLGKYAYPKPFSSNGWTAGEIPLQHWHSKGARNQNFDKVIPTGSPVYGSVNVPMTPGTTEVTFWDYGATLGKQNNLYGDVGDSTLLKTPEVLPDLSNYYAKKKEVENDSSQKTYNNNNAYRRYGSGGSRRNFGKKYRTNLRREERNLLSLSNLNYIIHVREKSRS